MIKRNIAANVLGRVWGIVSVYLFIPLYLEYLGVDAYGLVGFYSILMAVLVFADVGLTATITREMARLSVEQNPGPEMRDTLRTYETSYVLISTLLSGVLWILAPTIAGHWLRSRVLQSNEMVHALRLMGVAIALQFPAGLYIGGLIGLQQQVLTNSLQAVWGLVRGLG